MALVTTPGAANADSYATIAEADAYNASRPFATAWTGTDAVKEAALRQACRLLDSCFRWTGQAVDDVQVLTWPRGGMTTRNGYPISVTVVPQQLKNAQSEWARRLLEDDLTSDLDQDKENLSELKVGPIAMKFKTQQSTTLELRDADIIARNPEFDYLWKAVPDAVRNLLVPSWYLTSRISRPLLFEVGR